MILVLAGKYFTWNKWGRVGAVAGKALIAHASLDAAKADFEKKFFDKTKNRW